MYRIILIKDVRSVDNYQIVQMCFELKLYLYGKILSTTHMNGGIYMFMIVMSLIVTSVIGVIIATEVSAEGEQV